ncbi:hypothetical protein NEISICOT_01478 [Neisseria sicca ATCC 29256]|uniref:Uncharacterized protein n=1 Tax=Neisseria sicca ATCC 29256 TaxID=547045 RepID=C6M4N1_NEISI|nr:hypothetical protein [Neisseria sicca]EET44814.1 hypothetical protein NEISICOT_01478 [Neisseria sicca ATCC 29256]QMT38379.1 hypothetical protein H3L95_01675 [Neisseria sicca]
MELILSMIRKVFIFSTVIALSGCFAGKHKVQALPDAELNKPYFIELRTKYAAYPNHFNVEMDPPNSGLTVTPTNMWYNKLNISGTPITKQDIKIEISYYVRGAVGWFESMDQKEFYQIKVKE